MVRKIKAKLVLRLCAEGLTGRQIAPQGMSRTSVAAVIEAADREGISWDDVASLEEAEVYARLFPGRGDHASVHAQPDWDRVHLQRHYGRKVQRNGHVVFERNFYTPSLTPTSAETVDLRVIDTSIEVFAGDQRLTSHLPAPAGMINEYRTHEIDLPAGPATGRSTLNGRGSGGQDRRQHDGRGEPDLRVCSRR